MVLICQKRFGVAKNLDKTGIVQAESGGFSIISRIDNVERYSVSIGDNENMPSYPFKHFSVAFLKFPNWSWDALF